MGLAAWSEPLPGATGAVKAQPTIYRGVTVRETAGAVAVVRLFDDPDSANGTLLETVSLAANASFSALYDDGIRAAHGIYAEITGAVEGAVRFA